jgi:hypothetical protein
MRSLKIKMNSGAPACPSYAARPTMEFEFYILHKYINDTKSYFYLYKWHMLAPSNSMLAAFSRITRNAPVAGRLPVNGMRTTGRLTCFQTLYAACKIRGASSTSQE